MSKMAKVHQPNCFNSSLKKQLPVNGEIHTFLVIGITEILCNGRDPFRSSDVMCSFSGKDSDF